MKEKGEGLWLIWEDVPKSYQDWLVKAVSMPDLFLRIASLNKQGHERWRHTIHARV